MSKPAYSNIDTIHSDLLSESSGNFFEKSESQRSGIQNRSIPKGFLSEYQHSYLKQDKTNKIIKNRAKDTWSFESKSLLNEPFLLSNDNGSQNLRAEKFPTVYKSKALDRLNNLVPTENHSADWSVESDEKIRKPYNSLNRYKADYIRQFDEINRGLADSYTNSKGGVLLKLAAANSNSSKSSKVAETNQKAASNLVYSKYLPPETNAFEFDSSSESKLLVHDQDFRSIWVPKKFEGRNMFASHIDSAIFPDKRERTYETAYSQMNDPNSDSRKSFEKPTYEKIEKTMKYVINHENRYVPVIKWTPRKETFMNDNMVISNTNMPMPKKSVYQADFAKPSTIDFNSSRYNQTHVASSIQSLLQQ